MGVRAPNVDRNMVLIVKRDVHALQKFSVSGCDTNDNSARTRLVEFSIPIIKNHLEGDVGPILDTRDSCRGGHDMDTPRRAIALEVTYDKLVGTSSSAEVTE